MISSSVPVCWPRLALRYTFGISCPSPQPELERKVQRARSGLEGRDEGSLCSLHITVPWPRANLPATKYQDRATATAPLLRRARTHCRPYRSPSRSPSTPLCADRRPPAHPPPAPLGPLPFPRRHCRPAARGGFPRARELSKRSPCSHFKFHLKSKSAMASLLLEMQREQAEEMGEPTAQTGGEDAAAETDSASSLWAVQIRALTRMGMSRHPPVARSKWTAPSAFVRLVTTSSMPRTTRVAIENITHLLWDLSWRRAVRFPIFFRERAKQAGGARIRNAR